MGSQSDRDQRSEKDRQDEYVRGGKGRRDEVGKSGIYPASSPDAPADAEIRTESDLVRHEGARRTPGSEEKQKED
jgi:hypothetical protein